MSPPMSPVLAESVAATHELVEPQLRKAVARLDPLMHRVSGYQLGWTDGDGAPVTGGSGGGKGLRPTLVLLSARACGGELSAAVQFAVAVELVHNFSLLHDDVMDGDEQRRHRPTVWKAFGVPSAVLAGDALLALALETVLRAETADAHVTTRLAGCLAGAVSDLIGGQSADLDFERRSDVSLAEGLAMADGKTAALLRCCAAGGATAVGAPAAAVELLAGFGHHLGTAFQATDDLLGIWGDPQVTGKPALADLRCRKKSLPVLAALADPGPAGERVRALYRREETFTEPQLAAVAAAIERAGGRTWAERCAQQHSRQARRCLMQLDAEPAALRALIALADYVTRRDR